MKYRDGFTELWEAIIEFEKMFDESGIGVLMTLEQVEILRYRK